MLACAFQWANEPEYLQDAQPPDERETGERGREREREEETEEDEKEQKKDKKKNRSDFSQIDENRILLITILQLPIE